jgi:predicted esterase
MDSFPQPSEIDPPLPSHDDEASMKGAVDRVHKLIQRELDKGIDADRIVLAGFSQGEFARRLPRVVELTSARPTGCAITLLAGLSTKEQLGGLMCMSGWLPLAEQIRNEKHPVR